MYTFPEVGLSTPPIKCNKVDFPLPLAPTMAINSPLLIVNEISSTAFIFVSPLPYVFTKIAYFFTRNKLIKMMLDEPNITFEELHKIAIPVHILAGEKDVIKLEHTKLIAENIKNSTLKIILKETHGSYIVHSEKIYEILKEYL